MLDGSEHRPRGGTLGAFAPADVQGTISSSPPARGQGFTREKLGQQFGSQAWAQGEFFLERHRYAPGPVAETSRQA